VTSAAVGGASAAVGGASVSEGGGRWPVRSGAGAGAGRSSRKREKKRSEMRRSEGGGGGLGGAGPGGCGSNPAWSRREARFELLSSAWLRGLFWVKWALLRSTEPGYQTIKSGKRWDEVRISQLPQSTKHTLSN
jgi:hypothetical protein